MDNQQHHHGNGFMNGFLLGAIVGAAVVFFLFTDKGKKLLKTITEEGIEGFADLQDIVGEELGEDEYEEYDEPSYDTSSDGRQEHQRSESVQHEVHTPSKAKRFFRGIKR